MKDYKDSGCRACIMNAGKNWPYEKGRFYKVFINLNNDKPYLYKKTDGGSRLTSIEYIETQGGRIVYDYSK